MPDTSKTYQEQAEEIALLKQRIQELQESESRYKMLFSNAAEGILVAELQTKQLIHANPALCRMFGFTEEEILRLRVKDIHPKDYLAEVLSEFETLARGEKTCAIDIPCTRKDGSVFYADICTASMVLDGVMCNVGFFTDITERKQAENALRKSEARFRSYFELPLIGIAITSPEKGWIEVNNRLSDILGYSVQELKGMSWSELTYPEDLDADVEQFNRVLAGEIDSYMIDKRFIRKDGEVIWTSLAVGCVRKQDGKVDYIVALLDDITERVRADEKLQQTLGSLRKAVGATVQVMVSTVEMRDPYTAGHQLRVADLARTIATEMGLPQDKIEGIRMAGFIHDIGKLSIPSEILSKPTKLTNIEFSLIKEHAQSGYEMLKNVESPWPLAQIVYQHHERMNGTGYPRNLKGNEILMEARIMAVADVVEAMASHRPYRAALGIEVALEEIEKNKGIIYDVDVADACLKLFREKSYQLK